MLEDMERTKPFLKWAGGKFKLVDAITKMFPPHPVRYIEPFVGAGAVALNVDFSTVMINDCNKELINVWKTLQMYPEELIRECNILFCGHFNNAEDYYKLRQEFNSQVGTIRQAALFIYFNKHGFNGLCRFNRKGEFNVPFGKYKTVNFDADNLRKISQKIAGWKIDCQDFGHILLQAKEGDVVYADPPYVTDAQVKSGFTAYSKDAFTLQDQENLAVAARAAADRGAVVIVSNHDTEYTRELYTIHDATLVFLEVQRNISCDGNNRKKAHELLACFTPKNRLDK